MISFIIVYQCLQDKKNFLKIKLDLPKISRLKFEKMLKIVIKKKEILIFLFENRRSSKKMLFGYFVRVLILY